jgi:hypothetical protein
MAFQSAGKTKIAVDTSVLADGDSIAAYLVAGGTQLTATGTSLDVNVTASALPTGAATETTLASILSEVQALSHAEDAAHVSGDLGVMSLAVRNDAGTALAADGDYIPLSTDANGALRVSGTFDAAGDYAEDSAATDGDIGISMLAVRNDNQGTTVTSANSDYSWMSVDDRGAMFVKDVAARSNLQQVISVGTTAVALPASPLANRSNMFVQLLSGGQLYLGSATVTNSGATRGLQLGQGGFATLSVGPSNLVYGVGSSANREVMVWEFA